MALDEIKEMRRDLKLEQLAEALTSQDLTNSQREVILTIYTKLDRTNSRLNWIIVLLFILVLTIASSAFN